MPAHTRTPVDVPHSCVHDVLERHVWIGLLQLAGHLVHAQHQHAAEKVDDQAECGVVAVVAFVAGLCTGRNDCTGQEHEEYLGQEQQQQQHTRRHAFVVSARKQSAAGLLTAGDSNDDSLPKCSQAAGQPGVNSAHWHFSSLHQSITSWPPQSAHLQEAAAHEGGRIGQRLEAYARARACRGHTGLQGPLHLLALHCVCLCVAGAGSKAGMRTTVSSMHGRGGGAAARVSSLW